MIRSPRNIDISKYVKRNNHRRESGAFVHSVCVMEQKRGASYIDSVPDRLTWLRDEKNMQGLQCATPEHG